VLFNSFEFAVFLPVVLGVHFALPPRLRWILLLGASYYFYMAWRPRYVVLLLASTVVDYFVGRAMERCPDSRSRRPYLAISLTANLGLLLTFKYYSFFAGVLAAILRGGGAGWEPPVLDVTLPIGISFYTFQTLSYSLDIYRGQWRAERNPGRFALFVSFFPQLVAGPIERAGRLLPELSAKRAFDPQSVADGLRRVGWGLFKKVVLADRAARIVDFVYAAPGEKGGPALAAATVLFAFQIYCDFSGYSDIAVGVARMFGIRLRENFRAPYFARSVREFWQRWHISLSTWFRDYVYIPLGGSRAGRARSSFNLLVVFVVSGLWHGANWTFVLWGAYFGLWMILSRATATIRERIAMGLGLRGWPWLRTALQTGITFAFVNLGWVLFRAATPGDAVLIFSRLGHGWGELQGPSAVGHLVAELGMPLGELVLTGCWILVLLLAEARSTDTPPMESLAQQPGWLRWSAYYGICLAILVFGIFDETPFVYFQF
jgi:D-alanyl-lipoteichoic acid acyltransferase DltB (MBOAT superfamily)